MNYQNTQVDEAYKLIRVQKQIGTPNPKNPHRYREEAIWECESLLGIKHLIRGPLAQVLERHGFNLELKAV